MTALSHGLNIGGALMLMGVVVHLAESHDHVHDPMPSGAHSHPHRHRAVRHTHAHMPDIHHGHRH